MIELAAALAFLFLTHIVPSSGMCRPALVRTLGLAGFRLAYSMLSLVSVAWIVLAYKGAADSIWLWTVPDWSRWVAVSLMPVAFWLIAVRLIQPPNGRRFGVYRFVPAPGSVGLALWAFLHLLNVGEARAVMLFAAFAAVSVVALVKNTRTASRMRPRSARSGTPDWLPVVAAVAAWVLLLWVHPHVFGVDPLGGAVR